MTLVLYTDASTKNGASAWAFKHDNATDSGIIVTTNVAAAEMCAIVKGLENTGLGTPVLVVTDSLGAAKVINDYRKNKKEKYKGSAKIYNILKSSLYYRLEINENISAIWVASHCPIPEHLEVDQLAKTTLQEHLKGKLS